jgi:secondary thiamine-phosphate synthase enzyme
MSESVIGMTRRSTPTLRATPVTDVVTAGGLRVHAETFTIDSSEHIELFDVTPRVTDVIRASGIREGLASVWSMHTTCAIFANESQQALFVDIKRYIEELVAAGGSWLHNDPGHSDCDRANAESHLRSLALGHSLTLQVSGGEAVLGRWQRVLAAELDGPRARTIRVQVMGVA